MEETKAGATAEEPRRPYGFKRWEGSVLSKEFLSGLEHQAAAAAQQLEKYLSLLKEALHTVPSA